jgi:hypothetical protein
MTDFGYDTSATDGIRAGKLVRGVRLVAEAAYRRLITPAGSLRGGKDEENYGLDLSDYIGRVDSKAVASALPGVIRAELLKDDRIETVSVTVTRTDLGAGAYSYAIAIACTTSQDESFILTVAATDVDTTLLGIELQ